MVSRAAFVTFSFVSLLCLLIVACEDEDGCAATCNKYMMCCNAMGQCVSGNSQQSCGSDGMACQICTGTQTCTGGACQPTAGVACGTSGASCQTPQTCCDLGKNGGTCVPAGLECSNQLMCQNGQCSGQKTTCTPICTAGTCCDQGTCVGNGQPCPRLGGTCTNGVCSSTGLTCPCQAPSCCDTATNRCVGMNQVCTNGQSCVAGNCGTTTNCGTCNNPKCCDGTICRDPGVYCTTTNKVCKDGSCYGTTTTCNSTTCIGCCQGTTCLLPAGTPPQTTAACGSGSPGAVCTACAPGYACTNGKCAKAWRVFAVSVKIGSQWKPGCYEGCGDEDCWDTNDAFTGCAADPYIKCSVGGQTNQTPHQNDAFPTVYFSNFELFTVDAALLTAGINCEVRDDENFGSELMANCTIPVTSSQINAKTAFTTTSTSCAPSEVASDVVLQLSPAM